VSIVAATISAGQAVAFVAAATAWHQPGQHWLRAAPQQRQSEAEQRQHRDVGPAHRQRERNHRGRGDQDGPAQHILGSRSRQRGGEHRHEAHREPDPRIGDDSRAEQRSRQAEDRHHGQVRVVDVGVVRSGDHGLALVRGAVLEQQPGPPGDHGYLGLPPAFLGQQDERREQRATDPQEQGQIHRPRRFPGQDDPGGQHVSNGRE
jgi:hypothetical protein